MDTHARTNARVSRRSERVARTGVRPERRPESDATAEPLWDTRDVAAYLRLSVGAIYKLTGRRAASPIPHILVARKLRFRRSDVDRWLTLKTVSNLEHLTRLRDVLTKEPPHGHDQQEEIG